MMLSSPDPSAKFYVTYPSSGIARFESVLYPGKYLIIESTREGDKKAIRCGEPSNGNDMFTIVPILGQSPAAYKQGSDCFMAFDLDGEVYGPCGLSTENNWELEINIVFV